jgi:hypothetical protein
MVARDRNDLIKDLLLPASEGVTAAGSDFSPGLSAALCRQADNLQPNGDARITRLLTQVAARKSLTRALNSSGFSTAER